MNGDRLATVLEQALDLLREHGWCKGRNEDHGRYCVRGAIAKVMTGYAYSRSARVKTVYAFLTSVWGSTPEFLNDQSSSFAEVEGQLMRAISEARAT